MTMSRRLLALGLALALVPVTWLRSPLPPPDHGQQLTLAPVRAGAALPGPFRLAGVWQLTSPDSRFGSYSALVSQRPGQLLAISDRGFFLDFAMPGAGPSRARFGWLPGAAIRDKMFRDMEAAARDPASGRIFIAFEGRNAVARHLPDLGEQGLSQVPEMRGWGANTGPEAMVRLADGRFVIICECQTGWLASGRHPALLFAGEPGASGAARRFTLAGAEGYRPTDMALLPDGWVLVLVRRLTWPMPPRFKARLLLADPDDIAPGGLWRTVVLADLAAPLPVDNFEALTVTAGEDGKSIAWLLSDDNQALSQRTLLWKLEFSPSDLPHKQKAPGIPDAPR